MECRSSPALSPSMYLWRLWRKTRLAVHLSYSVCGHNLFLSSFQFNSILFVQHQNNSHLKVLAIPFFVFCFYITLPAPTFSTLWREKNNNYFKELQHLTCDTTSPKRAGTVYEIWIKAEYNALHISWSHILFTNIENISNVKTDKMENLKKHK